MPENRGQLIARLPGRRKIVWRLWLENGRAFDSGNPVGGNQQEVCAALDIRENGIARGRVRCVGEIDMLARGGIALLQPVRAAMLLNDLA